MQSAQNKNYYDFGNTNGYNSGYEKGKQDGLAQASYHMVKLTEKEASGKVDVSSYPGYQNFTVDNFVFKNIGKKGSGDYSTPAKYEYNPDTGIFTFKHGGGWCYWDGPYIAAVGTAETWLIY